MGNGEIIYWLLEIIIGTYMLGIGFKFFPDPGKKGSEKNEAHFNKYRNIFKIGGIFLLVYALFSIFGPTLIY